MFRYTGGVPQLINVLCDSAMLCAFADEKNRVDQELLEAAVDELQWVPYIERLRERERILDNTDERYIGGIPLARLEIRENNQIISNFELPAGRVIIGRDKGNDLTIPSKLISRHHAQIVTDLQQSMLEDLNSTNGIYVGSKRVPHHQLNDGDIITIGRHEILYRNLRGREQEHEIQDDPEDTARERTKR